MSTKDRIILIGTCQQCYRSTDINELTSNSKYGSYMFKEICNSCANKYDKMNDEHKQDRAGRLFD